MVTEEELETIIDTVENEGVIDKDKCERIQSVFDFGDVQVSGDMRMEDFFNEVDFDDRDFDDDNITVGGFVVELLGRHAEVGDVVTYKNIMFTMAEVEGHRVIKRNVQVTPVELQLQE